MLDNIRFLIRFNHCISNCIFVNEKYDLEVILSLASNDKLERALNCNLTTMLFKPNVRRNVHDTTQAVKEEVLMAEKNLKKKMIRILMKPKYKDTV